MFLSPSSEVMEQTKNQKQNNVIDTLTSRDCNSEQENAETAVSLTQKKWRSEMSSWCRE